MRTLLRGPRAIVFLAAGTLALAAIAIVGVIYFSGGTPIRAPQDGGQAETASFRSFVMHEAPRPLLEIKFEDGNGHALTQTDLKGKTVLLNIWATWCVPCREEMPTLDALEAELGGPTFEVVPLSVDRAGPDVVRKFYAEIGIEHLGLYVDATMRASFNLQAPGLPTTLLIDSEGRELGRLVGSAEWNTPEMIAFLNTHLKSN
ncbi:TlpA family protein disulfide reductase [Roseibium aggregatum]|jgi:thiol-disulfide isomerase/thioredoxin|uniref:TlpA family protein disulfide reductase n=1 Tax=Roseibium aggregatum TaxID=187304 RepID=UPI001E361FF5|nr:TlpA disulfide reductase family protein [Roseibium aggregatum]UES47988.1 redoxin family protein [Roseibium aggregatum]